MLHLGQTFCFYSLKMFFFFNLSPKMDRPLKTICVTNLFLIEVLLIKRFVHVKKLFLNVPNSLLRITTN